ncbi:Alpha/beta hydrolase family protein [Rubripirellula tenax]|uniref:Alpha/beta hydrolase family protein n=1 Tax=Rubripirellula tenax TaxID=2528015 RepID=A0A5C6FEP6_9BACT|nr:sialate O-acetylesterase [Rubripirellula tenax]TWU58586.1 Alpha/beta hydrolase family protein [Rubripirellula tenax]
MMRRFIPMVILLAMLVGPPTTGVSPGNEPATLTGLASGIAPRNFAEMWDDFDPRAEPLETETLHEWEEDGVLLRVVRFRIGVFKGQPAKLAAIFGIPKSAVDSGEKIPGLVQIHGGGQFADHRACLMNAKRGYATVSIAWAGRISAPQYRVSEPEVKLFWDNKTNDPRYRQTTDWGAVDGYHAPCRNPKNNFLSVAPAAWTIDDVESPCNCPWFLCAIAARRALTFLEQQPVVDAEKLGVYGHSMGGKLTVMASVDARVKAAAPSCGGISDRDNDSQLYRTTISDDVNLRHIKCPIIFLSPSNDFHGRIGDLPRAVEEIQSKDWRVTCSPHHNHQDSAEYEVASLLWFDQHLKGNFEFPSTPETSVDLSEKNGTPTITVTPDAAREPLSVDVFYTQHGQDTETSSDRDSVVNRFWRCAKSTRKDKAWTAKLPLGTVDKPLWVFANVTYALDEPVTGAGYYYRIYETVTFNVSSLLEQVSPQTLQSAGIKPTLRPESMIESFGKDWNKEWFSHRPETWPQSTHKLHDEQFQAPSSNARLAIEVHCDQPNELVVKIDDHAVAVDVTKPDQWQQVMVSRSDLRNHAGESLPDWTGMGKLKLSDTERLQPTKPASGPPKIVGKNWQGNDPQFRNLRWVDPPSTYDVYLLAGQSNMDGRGSVDDLTPIQQRPLGNAIIFYRNPPHSTNTWKPLLPGFSIAPRYKGDLPSPTFGPEIGFAIAMTDANPSQKLALIKGSKGATSLRVDWDPGESGKPETQGPCYRNFVETFRLATDSLTRDGHQFVVRGLLWHQGESDSKTSKDVYQERLLRFIDRIREDTEFANLPVVVGEVFDNGKRDSVRAAIEAVGTRGAGYGFVSSSETTTSDPGTHFDAASQLLLGKRYAEAIIPLVSKRELSVKE